MGLRFQDVVDGREDALAILADLGGADLEALSRSALQKGIGEDFALAGEAVSRSMLRRSRVRVCPDCLADGLARWPALGAAAPFQRTEWTLSSLRTCPSHGLSLVTVADDQSPAVVHDFSALVGGKLSQLEAWRDQATRRSPSHLEQYLRARIAGCRTHPWLDALPFYAAAKLCEVLGAIALHGPKVNLEALGDHEMWEAGGVGHDIAADGPRGIRSLLDQLASAYSLRVGGPGPKALFGRLYEWLAHESEDPAYDPVRHIIREHVVDTMPVGPEDEIFGTPVAERRVWSIHQAAKATGTHPKRLRKLLVAGGVVGPDIKDQTDDQVVFQADQAAADFLARAATAMSLKEVGRYINAPRVQLRLLFEQGFIRPFVAGTLDIMFDHAFAKQDLDEFVARLLTDARNAHLDDADLMDIPAAARKARCSAGDIVALLLDRRLRRVGRRSGVEGYMSVLVDADEVRSLTLRHATAGLSLQDVERQTGWSQKLVRALVDSGLLPSTTIRNPVTRLPQRVVAPDDLKAFTDEYVSLHQLAKERGVHFLRLKTELEAAGWKRCSAGQGFRRGSIGAQTYVSPPDEATCRDQQVSLAKTLTSGYLRH
jgi:hypothetical protein